ncbi:lysozyme [Rhizobium rhizogenes]|uniref:lysozyme n=1 Tax=Rhizobium rhizogenes TaxID=359 RepID=UPI0004D7AC30|nr:lysozyme [Rhizobium rhizogenes]KEA07473.1 glycoside hydrolase [Rhizobium rhizogenes]NTJ22258.1 lysozyme [Rhizobium rhizogenes]QUE80975.1 lysozyme [Rhizobium rhizogenes]TQO80920.1 lysozyme [Rhizobium rhizogenes]TRB51514.1 glycoside hydrolase [Rhizobium rhizogenes]
MPINKIVATKRGKAAIAAVVAMAISGSVALFPGQPPVHDDTALAVQTLVQPWEGRSLKAYLDTIPKHPVWTICDGDTDNVKAGMVETPAGCNKRVAVKMERDYRAPVVKCIGDWDKKPLSWRAMILSLSWNIGVGAACNSTAARLGRAGEYEQSCKAATAFNKAGGRVIIGIVRRREMGDAQRIGEAELCVSGLPS